MKITISIQVTIEGRVVATRPIEVGQAGLPLDQGLLVSVVGEPGLVTAHHNEQVNVIIPLTLVMEPGRPKVCTCVGHAGNNIMCDLHGSWQKR